MKCEKCGQWVDWNNPNIHYGGHTCDPIDVAEQNLKKMKEEKSSGGVYDFNGMKDEEIGRLKNTVYEQNRTINELRERLNNKPEKRNILPSGDIPLTEEERKEFQGIMRFFSDDYVIKLSTRGYLYYKYKDQSPTPFCNIKAILWLAERFNLTVIKE